MRTRTRNPFTTISTAGLLLPVDLLSRIVDGDPNLPGLTAKDYHLCSGERLNEAASRAWNESLAAWKSFRKKFAALPASDTGTTLTRDEWLLRLFQELGYGRLQAKRAIVIDGKEYPISHGWEDHVPIHLLSARYSIDRRTPGAAGEATRAPYSLLQELLNRSGKHRWGFVTNGLKLYLLHDNAALARAANVEFDLEAMMDGELYADFMLLFLLCHQSRVEIQPSPIAKVTLDRKTGRAKRAKATSQKKPVTDDDAETADVDESVDAEEEKPRLGPENCWLERWANQADQQGTRARDKLRDGVEAAIRSLGAGFLTTKGNQDLRERMRTGELSTQDYYRQLLRVVYRLLMLLVAEEKKTENGANLFHPPGTPPEVSDRYARFYSVSRIRTLAYERRGTAHTDLYESLKVLFLKLREGYAPLGIPGMGSFLFSDDSTPDLDDAVLANQDLLDAFRNLCYTEDTSGRGGSIRRPVDFGSLGSDELGSVYESLLELHPKIDTDEGPFTLGTASGNERKTTGSYYTPTSLINCLLDSALDPVVHAAIDVSDRAEAERKLLNLKVCDPACGSGHFLIAAAERMAMHLARLRTGDDEPNTLDVQHAKRDIIGRCIYGVDINPMAVELCKVALWMEAMEPGKPFSYLDHHIQCGNSLLGTTPALLAKGIPDDAFTPIEGDVKSRVSELKKQNKKERLDRINRQTELFEPPLKLGNLSSEFVRLNILDDDSISDIRSLEERYTALVRGADYQNARLLADTWCAAFVWKKDDSDLGKLCPTERDFRKVESHASAGLLPHVRTEVERLRNQYQFFHWHLAFPDVFRFLGNESQPENDHTGWNGGFDAILGNPPWESSDLMKVEFYATLLPAVARARTTEDRMQIISEAVRTNPQLDDLWQAAVRANEGGSHLVKNSGLYPFTSGGKLNTYRTFGESCTFLVRSDGRAGVILKSGIVNAQDNQEFFADLLRNSRVVTVFDFINTAGLFEDVVANERFCNLTIMGRNGGVDRAIFMFGLDSIDQVRDSTRQIVLSSEELATLNPNDLSVPPLTSARDQSILLKVHRRIPVLVNEADRTNFHEVRYSRGHLNSSTDSGLFSKNTLEVLRDEGIVDDNGNWDGTQVRPLIEGKLIGLVNHRFGTFEGVNRQSRFGKKAEARNPTVAELQSASFRAMPRFWLRTQEALNLLTSKNCSLEWLVTYRHVCRAFVDARTAQICISPTEPTSDSCALLLIDSPRSDAALSACLIVGAWSSFVGDYVLRQKIYGPALTKAIGQQLPAPTTHTLNQFPLHGWSPEFLKARIIELIYTAWDLEPFAQDCGYGGPPFRWDEERRFQLRAELDATFFHLYLPSDPHDDWLPAANESPDDLARLKESFPQPRDAVSYIMDTFPIVRRKDIAKHGTYRTKDTILEVYDAMQTAIRTGLPYQTSLTPPPGPPTDANGHFIPFAQWTSHLNTSHIHPPRIDRHRVERGRLVLDLLLLLKAWNKPVSITALEPALLLMRNEAARKALLAQTVTPTQVADLRSEPRFFTGIDGVYQAVEANGAIRRVGDNGYELAKPELLKDASQSDRDRAAEVIQGVNALHDLRTLSDVVARLTEERYEVTV